MNSIKFCSKCGSSIGDNEKFCGTCGASVEEMEKEMQPAGSAPEVNNVQSQPQNVQPSQTYQQPAYTNPQANNSGTAAKSFDFGAWIKKHVAIIAIAGAAIVAVVVAVIILLNMMKYQTIDAKELFRIDFKGLDTCGTAFATLNDKDIYLSEVRKEINSDKSIFTYEDYETLSAVDEEEFSDYLSSDEKTLKEAWTKADT